MNTFRLSATFPAFRLQAAIAVMLLGTATFALPAHAADSTASASATRGATTRFHFDDIPVRSALQFLAEEGDFNLVVSDSVQGNISLHLEDVTWEQVLDIVLKLEGLEQQVVGNSRTVRAAGG